MAIRALSDRVISLIAAGEVIVRPASAMRELVENSLDASATRVAVRIEGGGASLIEVEDDGIGIVADELALAVARHATSKLRDDDIESISTMGFRGEALAAMGAVSHLTVASRAKDSEHGASISVNYGKSEEMRPLAMAQGTKVSLQDLFAKVPARLKFLKKPQTENGHHLDALQRLAIAFPDVVFSLHFDGKQKLMLPASDVAARVRQILGEELMDNSLLCEGGRDHSHVKGYASLPTYSAASSSLLYCYVNRRPVRDRLVTAAVRAAYGDSLPRGRHPMGVLFLSIASEWVDMNVHPTKAEVRFRDPYGVRTLIVHTIRDAIMRGGARVASSVHERAAAIVHKTKAPPPTPASMPARRSSQPMDDTPSLPLVMSSQPSPPPPPDDMTVSPQDTTPLTQSPLGDAVAQIHDMYIVAQSARGMVLVDQHAAHERIVYEKLKEQWRAGEVTSHALLVPVVVHMARAEQMALLRAKEMLSKWGFAVDEFGKEAITVRTVPHLLKDVAIEKLIKELAQCLLPDGSDDEKQRAEEQIERMQEAVLSLVACHGSVRAGRVMNKSEMNALLRSIEQTPLAAQCNHGRPVYVEFSSQQLGRFFDRH